MAELVGCYDDSVISRIESGERLPTLPVALAYQAFLEVPLNTESTALSRDNQAPS